MNAVIQSIPVKKKQIWKIEQNSPENTCRSLFFNKIEVYRPVTLLKKDSSKCFFSCKFQKVFQNRDYSLDLIRFLTSAPHSPVRSPGAF